MSGQLFLVDFENVPAVDLKEIDSESKVIVFTGVSQKSVPLDLVTATQRFGERLEWRRVDASGRNALDFFIACELGRVHATGNDTACFVVSNDKGFDPLIRYLNGIGLRCERLGVAMPSSKPESKDTPKPPAKPSADPEHLKRALEVLGKSEKKSRPRKHKTLAQHIGSIFQKKLSKSQVEEIIAEMLKSGKIAENGTAISYNF